jgi:hypothetical protein
VLGNGQIPVVGLNWWLGVKKCDHVARFQPSKPISVTEIGPANGAKQLALLCQQGRIFLENKDSNQTTQRVCDTHLNSIHVCIQQAFLFFVQGLHLATVLVISSWKLAVNASQITSYISAPSAEVCSVRSGEITILW